MIDLARINRARGIGLFDYLLPDEFGLPRLNSLKLLRSPFVAEVLGDEFALDGEREDGFAEVGGGDGVGRVEEEREVGWGGRVGKAGQRRAGERGVFRRAFLLLGLQPIT